MKEMISFVVKEHRVRLKIIRFVFNLFQFRSKHLDFTQITSWRILMIGLRIFSFDKKCSIANKNLFYALRSI